MPEQREYRRWSTNSGTQWLMGVGWKCLPSPCQHCVAVCDNLIPVSCDKCESHPCRCTELQSHWSTSIGACSKCQHGCWKGIHPPPWRRSWSPILGSVFLNTLCLPCQGAPTCSSFAFFACKDLPSISKQSRTQLLCRFTPQFQSTVIHKGKASYKFIWIKLIPLGSYARAQKWN